MCVPVEWHWADHRCWHTRMSVVPGCCPWTCCKLLGTLSGRSGCSGRCAAAHARYEQTEKAWLASRIHLQLWSFLHFLHYTTKRRKIVIQSLLKRNNDLTEMVFFFFFTCIRFGRLLSSSLRDRKPYSQGFSSAPWTAWYRWLSSSTFIPLGTWSVSWDMRRASSW